MVVAGQMPEPVGQKPEAMLLRILPVQERFPVQGVDGKDEAPELDGDVFVLRPGDLLVYATPCMAALMEGAAQAMEALAAPGADNPAWQYAAARHALYTQGKKVEILVGYEPSFRFFGEWWKQLFGETEGKDGKALFPASVEFTADLHSMGQYIQQGERLMLETVVRFARSRGSVTIPHDPDNVDGLNFLAGKDLSFVAEQAMRGTLLAHVDGGVPNLVVTAPARDAQSVGWLIYFFEYACGLSGYLLEINPFDQPGVEAYKKNMFALLGKPGYEDLRQTLLGKLEK